MRKAASAALSGCVLAASLSACGGSPGSPSASSGYTADMQAALSAANRFAVDLTTFDYRTLDAFYAKVEAQGTAYLKQNLEANRADTTAYDRRVEVISQGSVVASAAKPAADDGSVTVLLFVDQRLRRKGATSGLLEQVRMQIVMKRVNGAWLADQTTVTGSS